MPDSDYPVAVPLSRSYEIHGRTFEVIRMRPPRWKDWVEVGPVEQWFQSGAVEWHAPLSDAIKSYGDRLCQDSAELLDLDLVDAMAVQDQIIGFFREARASKDSRENSSTDSTGDPPTSTD